MSKPVYPGDKCYWCKPPVTPFNCSNTMILLDGELYARRPYGYERWLLADGSEFDRVAEQQHKPEQCPDCGVALKEYHHLCCDLEQCPCCCGYLSLCECGLITSDREEVRQWMS